MSAVPRITFTALNEAGDEVSLSVPARWEICGCCNGNGSSSSYLGAITADEWNGPDWDDDSRDDYMSGRYDRPCDECRGLGRIQVVDEERCRSDADKLALAALRATEIEEAEYRAMCAAERRAGA